MARLTRYPPNWKKISQERIEQSLKRCEACLTPQGTLFEVTRGRLAGVLFPVILVAAHVERNDTTNPNPEVLCLCPKCHALYDRGTPEQRRAILVAALATRSLVEGW